MTVSAKKILLVEDNPADAELLRELLLATDVPDQEILPLEIFNVPRLSEAVALIEKKRFDVVFLDLYLLDSHGLATLEQFRDACPEMTVVAMTGLGDSAIVPTVLAYGAVDCLEKGTDLDSTTVQHILRLAIAHHGIISEQENAITQSETVQEGNADLQRLKDRKGLRAVPLPIRSLQDGAILGYEFFCRSEWINLESPTKIFDAARKAGMDTEIDLACLQCGVDAIAKHKKGADEKNALRYHLNLLPQTLVEMPVEKILAILNAAKKPLCLEINERFLPVTNPTVLGRVIATLRQAGIDVAIEGLGYGHSNLESLLILEPNILKIDRKMIQAIATDETRKKTLRKLVQWGKNLKAEIIAVGIEQVADCDVLLKLGIELGQGHLWDSDGEEKSENVQKSERAYRVLFLDDNPAHGELLCEYLTKNSREFEVETCQHPKEFFEKIRKDSYDVFLVDFHLGQTTGLEVVRQLRKQGIKTPVVVLSSATDETMIAQCRAEGIADFVLKSRTAFSTLPRVIRRRIQTSFDNVTH